MSGDWLWDESGEPDPEVERLASLLAPYRRPPSRLRPIQSMRRTGRPTPSAFVAAAALLLAATLLYFAAPERPDATPAVASQSPYSFERLAGRVDVMGSDGERLLPGASIVCSDDASARVRVAGIGSVVLEGRSRLRVDADRAHDDDSGYLLHLDRGKLRASIFAAPRLFQLGTPSGIAVDLGCFYSATVRDDGSTLLEVDSGAVSFEVDGRKVRVPRGAECVATPRHGPGTPVWSDQDEALKDAVIAIDRADEPKAEDVARVISQTEARATLTLYHLLDHRSATVRGAALDALARLKPAAPLAREALLGGDRRAREELREALIEDWSSWGW